MTSSKKLLISAAVLAGGYALALLCGSPFLPELPGISDTSREQTDNGYTGVGATHLVPEEGPTAPALLNLPEFPEANSSPTNGNNIPLLVAAPPPKAHLTTVSAGPPKPTPAAANSSPAIAAAESEPSPSQLVQASFDAPVNTVVSPPTFVGLERVAPTDLGGQRTHLVVDGDSLVKLAERYLDNPNGGRDIFELNRGVLTDPDLLPIGAELKIPARSSARESPTDAGTPQHDPTMGVVPRGLVPVYEMPTQTSVAPRAQLMSPMPAGWPAEPTP